MANLNRAAHTWHCICIRSSSICSRGPAGRRADLYLRLSSIQSWIWISVSREVSINKIRDCYQAAKSCQLRSSSDHIVCFSGAGWVSNREVLQRRCVYKAVEDVIGGVLVVVGRCAHCEQYLHHYNTTRQLSESATKVVDAQKIETWKYSHHEESTVKMFANVIEIRWKKVNVWWFHETEQLCFFIQHNSWFVITGWYNKRLQYIHLKWDKLPPSTTSPQTLLTGYIYLWPDCSKCINKTSSHQLILSTKYYFRGL